MAANESASSSSGGLGDGNVVIQLLDQSHSERDTQELDQDQENDRDKIIAELTRANGILKANISTLYRTARAELARKNERIAELQANLDDLLFKRMNLAGQSRTLDDNNHLFAGTSQTQSQPSGSVTRSDSHTSST